MARYINKDDIAAEIRRRFDEYSSSILKHYDVCKEAKAQELGKILTFLDTLEVKGVDLDYIKKELDEAVRIYKPNGNFGWGTLYNVATHFFELGLKARKGE